jgi:type IV secretion system protein VirB6
VNQYAIFQLLWTNIAVPVDTVTAGMITAMLNWVGPQYRLAVPAYFVVWLLIAAWSSKPEVGQEAFRQIFLAGIIYSIACTATTFDYYVTNLVHGTVAEISAAIGGAFNNATTLNANSYDIIAMRAYSVGLAVFKNLPWYSWKSWVLGIVVVVYWFLSTMAILWMFAVFLISYVLTDFVIGVGPLFVSFFFFPFTRKWFDGWLSVLATGMLVQIFTAALGAMFVNVLGLILQQAATGMAGSQLGQVDGGVVIGELMMLVVAAAACCIFAIGAGALVLVASRIAGGVHADIGRLSTPSWLRSGNEGSAGQAGAGGSSPASGGGSGTPAGSSGGNSTAQTPDRQYAFSRTVGPAS